MKMSNKEAKTRGLKDASYLYQCDVCGKTIDNLGCLSVGKISYGLPIDPPPYDVYYKKDFCSLKCLKSELKNAYFGAKVFLTREVIEEIIA